MKTSARTNPLVRILNGLHPCRQHHGRAAKPKGLWAAMVCLVVAVQWVSAADFMVTSPGAFYRINNLEPNPTLTLIRGETYTFAVNTLPGPFGHPFQIISPAGTTSNNNISSGTITFRVPTNAVNYSYRCSVHPTITGTIVTVPPPTFRIVNLRVGANIVLRSTPTNWNLTPQYSTNLGGTNWFALTVQSNRFINGTNETFCGRPPVSNAFIRVRAQRN
jgi:hypothetical protein